MPTDRLIACHECDLLEQVEPAPTGGAARCRRCGALLYEHKRNSLDRTLALALSGLILFVVANSFPFLELKMQGLGTQTTLITGVHVLYQEGYWEVAGLVLLTTMIVPGSRLLGFLYLLLPLRFDHIPPATPAVSRLILMAESWSMVDVFVLGILVSVVKLAGMATIVPGIAVWAFALLMFALAGMNAMLDPRIVWNRLGPHS